MKIQVQEQRGSLETDKCIFNVKETLFINISELSGGREEIKNPLFSGSLQGYPHLKNRQLKVS